MDALEDSSESALTPPLQASSGPPGTPGHLEAPRCRVCPVELVWPLKEDPMCLDWPVLTLPSPVMDTEQINRERKGLSWLTVCAAQRVLWLFRLWQEGRRAVCHETRLSLCSRDSRAEDEVGVVWSPPRPPSPPSKPQHSPLRPQPRFLPLCPPFVSQCSPFSPSVHIGGPFLSVWGPRWPHAPSWWIPRHGLPTAVSSATRWGP